MLMSSVAQLDTYMPGPGLSACGACLLPSLDPPKAGTDMFILQMRKLRHREVKQLTRGHTAHK